MTSVFLIDDHPVIRSAVREAIAAEDDLTVCGEASTVDEAFHQIETRAPDVAIVDISLQDGHGLDLIQNIEAQYPDVDRIVFSMYNERVYAERAIRAGALGYVMKNQPTNQLIEAIRHVEDDDLYLSKSMTSRLLNKAASRQDSDSTSVTSQLTDRELSVFQMLGQGHSVEEIKTRLNLARKTIETYRRRAKEKLGFESVADLLRYAVKWTRTQGPGEETIPAPTASSME